LPLHDLAVSPTDVSGAGLKLTLNAPAPRPLASCRLVHPNGGVLAIGILGASHVVAVEDTKQLFSEQISCIAHAEAAALPERAEAPGYRLTSTAVTHDEVSFRQLARRLRERCAHDRGWLGGAFPGDEAALTALAATPDGAGWRWQSWHLYPAPVGGMVVHTTSTWRP
jgi:hypothetical protein